MQVEVPREDFSSFRIAVRDHVTQEYQDSCLRTGYYFLLDYFSKCTHSINGAAESISLLISESGQLQKVNPERIKIKIWSKRFLSDIIWTTLIPLGYPEIELNNLFKICLEQVVTQFDSSDTIKIEIEIPVLNIPELPIEAVNLAKLYYADNKKMLDERLERLRTGTDLHITILGDGYFDIQEHDIGLRSFKPIYSRPADYIVSQLSEESEPADYVRELRRRTAKRVIYR